MAMMLSTMANRGQNAYAKAAVAIEQTIGSMRTVASFTGEKHPISNYNKFLVTAFKLGVFQSFISEWIWSWFRCVDLLPQFCFGCLVWHENDSRKRLHWWPCDQCHCSCINRFNVSRTGISVYERLFHSIQDVEDTAMCPSRGYPRLVKFTFAILI